MKRILLVAADRALTRFMAEALMERTMDLPPRPDDPWDVARDLARFYGSVSDS